MVLPVTVTNQKDVLDAMFCLPISLESIDANCSILGHVWMEDLGKEKPWGGGGDQRAVLQDKITARHACRNVAWTHHVTLRRGGWEIPP